MWPTTPPQTKFPEIMHLYGVGDHGGGPTRQMLDEAVKMESPSATFPKTVFSTARQFFDDVEKSINKGASRRRCGRMNCTCSIIAAATPRNPKPRA